MQLSTFEHVIFAVTAALFVVWTNPISTPRLLLRIGCVLVKYKSLKVNAASALF